MARESNDPRGKHDWDVPHGIRSFRVVTTRVPNFVSALSRDLRPKRVVRIRPSSSLPGNLEIRDGSIDVLVRDDPAKLLEYLDPDTAQYSTNYIYKKKKKSSCVTYMWINLSTSAIVCIKKDAYKKYI